MLMACLCLVEDRKLGVFCVFLCSVFSGSIPWLSAPPSIGWCAGDNYPKIIPKPDGQVKPAQGKERFIPERRKINW
jgi:hypothetical protein